MVYTFSVDGKVVRIHNLDLTAWIGWVSRASVSPFRISQLPRIFYFSILFHKHLNRCISLLLNMSTTTLTHSLNARLSGLTVGWLSNRYFWYTHRILRKTSKKTSRKRWIFTPVNWSLSSISRFNLQSRSQSIQIGYKLIPRYYMEKKTIRNESYHML